MIVNLTRRYQFAASHRLHSKLLSDARNREVFGKCNNPYGHGHDYEVEVTVSGSVHELTGRAVDIGVLDALAERTILLPFRWRNLNEEVEAFRDAVVPTTENLAIEVTRRLREKWLDTFPGGSPSLEKVRIRETDRNICEIRAHE